MSVEKSIRILEFSGKNDHWDGWSEKFLANAEFSGYCKLLLCKKNKSGFDVVPTEKEYDKANEEDESGSDESLESSYAWRS